MGFNAATRNETRWSRGRSGSNGASSLGNGFHHKDAAPHPPPFCPYENVKNKR